MNADYTILIVDDEEANRDVLARRLRRQGYQIAFAEDGPLALESIRSQAVDLVVLDVMMPGMDGLEVLTTIRETHSIVDLPVIMATARDQSGDMVAALQMGANDYVTKPINFPVILARIQTQLAMKKARGESGETHAGGPKTLSAATPSDLTAKGSGANIILSEYEILGELGRGGMGVGRRLAS